MDGSESGNGRSKSTYQSDLETETEIVFTHNEGEDLPTSTKLQDVSGFQEIDLPSANPPQRQWLTPLLVGLGLGMAIAFISNTLAPKQNTAPAAKTPVETAASMSVTVVPVETTAVTRKLSATGTVAAYDLVAVLAQASGLQVKSILADEGDIVRVGQVLAVLDDSVLRSQLSEAQAKLESAQAVLQQRQADVGQFKAAVGQAQASLAEARANQAQAQRSFERYQSLANAGALSRQDLDIRATTATTAQEAVRVAQANISSAEAKISSAIANVSSAQAEVRSSAARLAQIKTQLGQTQVVAPANGIIASKVVRVGDVTSSFQNQALFTIVRNNLLELHVKIPESQIPEVEVGATVLVTSDADSRISLQGEVKEISPTVDTQTRQATVKISLPSGSSLLKPGMFLRAAITAESGQGLTVPAKAILPQGKGKALIYVLEGEDIARAKNVEVGTTMGGTSTSSPDAVVEIKSGLKVGDRVIVAGAGFIKDGDKVKVVSR